MKKGEFVSVAAYVTMIVCCLSGCKSTQPDTEESYRTLALPDSYKVYLLVSNLCGAPAAIVDAMQQNVTGALLVRDVDVESLASSFGKGTDGMLLKVDILRAFAGGVSKRIDIRYELVNRSNGEIMLAGQDAIKSKLGYTKITVALGNRMSARVQQLVDSLKTRGGQYGDHH